MNFVGHGTSGILGFPENYLYADELNIALKSMFNDRKFKNVRFNVITFAVVIRYLKDTYIYMI